MTVPDGTGIRIPRPLAFIVTCAPLTLVMPFAVWLSIGLGIVCTFVLVVLPALRPRQDAEPRTFAITSHPDCAACQLRAARRRREREPLAVTALLIVVALVVIGVARWVAG